MAFFSKILDGIHKLVSRLQRDDVCVMLDLETLGTKPGCVVISAGVVIFSLRRGYIAEREFVFSTSDSIRLGLTPEADTVAWWDSQSDAAKVILERALTKEYPLSVTCNNLTHFITTHAGTDTKKWTIWGNGAAFDIPVLEAVYNAAGLKTPWNHRNVRCYRTIRAMFKHETPSDGFDGVQHCAVDDARNQARHLMKVAIANELRLV